MFVSAQTLATLASFAAVFLTLAGGFGWIVRRSDTQFQRLADKIDERARVLHAKIDEQGRLLDAKIDEQTRALGAKIDTQTHELTEVKIAVARLEGPLPRIIPAR